MAIIRVSGNVGSGKTTLCKRFAEEFSYRYHYTGQIFREMAEEKGLSLEEFYQQIQNDPELEKSIDIKQMHLMLGVDNIIVQGRMAPFLPPFNNLDSSFRVAPRVVNVFVAVSQTEGALRQLNRPENSGKTLDEMIALSSQRMETERQRLSSLWGVPDCFDKSKFQIFLDTTAITIDQAYYIFSESIKSFNPPVKKY